MLYDLMRIDIKILVVIAALLALIFLFAHYRRKALVPFAIAFALALGWSFYFYYEYNGENVFLFNRINIYPLTLWTLGLTSLHLISYKITTNNRLFIGSVLYIVLLLVIEAIGYHGLNIRLISTYPSLFNLGVIHAPPIVKTFYLVAGPAYLYITHLIHSPTMLAYYKKLKK